MRDVCVRESFVTRMSCLRRSVRRLPLDAQCLIKSFKEETFKMEQLLHLSDENSFNFKVFFP